MPRPVSSSFLLALALVVWMSAGFISCSGNEANRHLGRNVVVLFQASDPRSLDPHRAGDVVSSRQSSNAYEMLYEYDYFKRPQRVIPCLATGLPEISEDGTVYTIKLRQDIRFQDDPCFPGGKGRIATAHDMEYSFKRFAALPDTTGWWTAVGKFKGLDEFRQLATAVTAGVEDGPKRQALLQEVIAQEIPAVKALDDYTIQYRLNEPFPQFIYVLTMSYYALVAKEAIEYYGKRIQFNPVGTGPFKLKEWQFGSKLVWVKNENFREQYYPEVPDDHKAADGLSEREAYAPYVGKRLPLADEIELRIIKETQTSWLEFVAGNIDVSGVSNDEFTAVIQQDELTEEMKEKGIELKKYDRPVIEYISYNMNDTRTGKPAGEKGAAIRKALSCGMNRQRYIDDYLNGRGSIATMMVPPSFPEFDGDYIYQWSQFNPEKGRKILEDAGFSVKEEGNRWQAYYPSGDKVTINILLRGITTASKDMAAFLTDAGNRVGIEVSPQMLQFQEFLQRQDDGIGQAYNAGWVMDYPDAENIMQLLYGPNAESHGVNHARYVNKEFDSLFSVMKLLNPNDPEELKRKKELIVQMHKILDEDCPWATVYFQRQFRLNHQWSIPNAPNDFFYGDLKYYFSDSKLRADTVKTWYNPPALPAILIVLLGLFAGGLFFVKVVKQD